MATWEHVVHCRKEAQDAKRLHVRAGEGSRPRQRSWRTEITYKMSKTIDNLGGVCSHAALKIEVINPGFE